jgi:hypothetical protein
MHFIFVFDSSHASFENIIHCKMRINSQVVLVEYFPAVVGAITANLSGSIRANLLVISKVKPFVNSSSAGSDKFLKARTKRRSLGVGLVGGGVRNHSQKKNG